MSKYMYLLFFLTSFGAFSQHVGMTNNTNQIDDGYVTDEKLIVRLKNNSSSNKDITVFAEQTNDSIFSIYIQNNTNDSIGISKQDWHLYLIQEARDSKNIWKPIEFWRYSWCGNSYVSDTLKSGEIIKTESKAYNGDFETEIRFKLLNNSKLYYSNAVKGRISPEQFIISDSVKTKSNFYNYSRVGGNKTAEKVIFLEPDGMSEYVAKNKKWVAKKARKRNKKETKKV